MYLHIVCICMYISLSIYIYIYMYIYTCLIVVRPALRAVRLRLRAVAGAFAGDEVHLRYNRDVS